MKLIAKPPVATAVALVLVLGFASCTTSDPAYAKLAAKSGSKASPGAIVGQWYARDHADQAHVEILSETLLTIRPDGTGSRKVTGGGRSLFMPVEMGKYGDDALTWSYAGGGVWDFRMHNPAIPMNGITKGTFRIAAGKLLSEARMPGPVPGIGFKNQNIFVKASDNAAVENERLKDARTMTTLGN